MAQNTFKQRQSSLEQFWNWRIDLFEKSDKDQVIQLAEEIIEKGNSNEEDFSREGIIARCLAKTTWKSFCRFGDRNSATGALRLCWIDNQKGMPLDTQALFISSDYNMDINPDELASFMMEYDHGTAYFPPYQEYENLKKIFKNLVGFNWNHKFAKQIILKKQIETGFF